MPAIQEQIEALKKRLESVLHVQDLIPNAAEQIEALKKELAEKEALLINTGGGAYVGGNVNTGGGDFTGRDKITNIYQGTYHGLAPRDQGEALAIYLGTLLDRCGVLPLQGFTDQSSDATSSRPRLSLTGVYIQLNTKVDVSEKKLQAALAAGKINSLNDLRPEQGRGGRSISEGEAEQGKALSALQAAILLPKMVLLGDPGSGKTTFVNFVAHAVAARRWDDLPDWPQQDRALIPILVTLRDFAYWLAAPQEKRPTGTAALWAYIQHDLEMRNLSGVAPVLEAALQNGQAFVLLDGLDEVPPTAESRGVILQIVQEFAARYRHSRYLITCRILSYDDPAWQLPARDFPALTLAPFNDEQIEAFIHAWHEEIAIGWNQPRHELTKLESKLRSEVARRPDLKRLAPNPLLLTVMALVHTSDGELPEARALLYERAVEILLWRWDQQKGKAQGEESRIITLLRAAGRDRNDLLVRLSALAYAAHQQVHDGDDAESVTGIGENELLNELRVLHPKQSRDWAAEVVETMKLRTGLLLERTGGAFTLPHRTFQEYLAGMHLARLSNFTSEALASLGRGDFWRIVVLLAVGYLVHSNKDYEKPRLLVEELCPPEAPDIPEAWRRAWLAGEVLLELGINRAQDTPHGKRLLLRVRERLVQVVEAGKLTPRERLEVADTLALLGDPRFDETRWHLPALLRGQPEPLLGFVKISAGTFMMGSAKDDKDAYDDEKPAHPVTLPDYWMARYPVTNAQYHHFIEADGYNSEKYWTPAGWAWRNGQDYDVATIKDDDLRKNYQGWLAKRPKDRRDRPYWWNDPQWGAPTRPVVGVSWYEAMAYCQWLDEQLRASQPDLFPKNYQVRLPTEAEWEKASRFSHLPVEDGLGVRAYPWGNDWQEDHANIDETGLKQTSPVGIFPKGATPETNLFDLSGNTWEWTHSAWGDDPYNVQYAYPYKMDDGRENANTAIMRILRGGSWNLNTRLARCANRVRLIPDNFYNNIGFRCSVSTCPRQGVAISDS